MADVAALAAHDHHAQVARQPLSSLALTENLLLGATANAQIQLFLVLVARPSAQLLTNRHALFGVVALLVLAPRHQLMGDEITVPVVNDRGDRAALELHERRVVTGNRTLLLPLANHRPHTAEHPPAQ